MLLPRYFCCERVVCSIDNVVALFMSLFRERKTENMKVGSTMLLSSILGACSLPDVQFVVYAKATSGYTREIPCQTYGDP